MPQSSHKRLGILGRLIWVRDLSLPATLRVILYGLVSRADVQGKCYPGLDRLCMDTGIKNTKHLSRKLAELEKLGYITRTSRGRHGGGRRSNLYWLHVDFQHDDGCAKGNSGYAGKVTDDAVKGDSRLPRSNQENVPGSKLEETNRGEGEHFVSATTPPGEDRGRHPGGKYTSIRTRELGELAAEEGRRLPNAANIIVASYKKEVSTSRAQVAFWHEMMRFQFPDIKLAKKLPKVQYKALTEFFHDMGPEAFHLIAHAICDWDSVSVYCAAAYGARRSPQRPTLAYINNNRQGVLDHWSEVRDWECQFAAERATKVSARQDACRDDTTQACFSAPETWEGVLEEYLAMESVTKRQLASLWQRLRASYSGNTTSPVTPAQMAMLGRLKDELGNRRIAEVVGNWSDYVLHVKDVDGLFRVPSAPNLKFLTAHLQAAFTFQPPTEDDAGDGELRFQHFERAW